MELINLKTLHMINPLGIDQLPYFSWKLVSDRRNVVQTSYKITVCDEDSNVVWDSGCCVSDQSTFVPYEGAPLKSCTRYTWTVCVQNNYEETAEQEAWFETAFLSQNDWQAKWVKSPFPLPEERKNAFGSQGAATYFKKPFNVDKKVKCAKVYATCHGVYELYINGERVDDRRFAPENTSYQWFLCYQTYDIARFLETGSNEIAMYVGDGWYCGVRTYPIFNGYEPIHAVLFQIEVDYEDGGHETFISDESVTCSEGPVLSSDLFAGEKYDANQTFSGNTPGIVAEYGYETLSAQLGEPVRTIVEVPCKEVLHTLNNETVLDFGQVICGAVRMKVNEPKGTVVKLEHSEVLDKDGNFTMNILGGTAQQIIEYTSSGDQDTYEPHFTFQGFRYVRVTGISDAKAEDFTAQIYSSEKENTGTFNCSDPRINRLYENTRWSQRANMLSIPTDCPQREKAGWTGDIQVYATTSMLNEDTTNFLTRWLKSLRCEQLPCGAVPMIVPMHGFYYKFFSALGKVFRNEGKIGASAGWSDASVLVPWQMYQVTGNTVIIQDQYDSMKKWCDYVIRAAQKKHDRKSKLPWYEEQYLWNSGYHWGEWLIPSMSVNGYGKDTLRSVMQSRKYIAPAFAYYSISSLAKMAEVIGKKEDAAYYGAYAKCIERAFKAWISANKGEMPIDLMGAYVIPLYFDLVPESYLEAFKQKLVAIVEKMDYCLDTGFLATPFLFDTLCKIGRKDLAFKIFYGEKAPSYFNQLNQGATTIWESWYVYKEDGNPMAVSLNHYAFGCIDDWIFRTFTGIDKTKPGFKEIRIAPDPDESLTFAKRSFESEYGTIISEWVKDEGQFKLHVKIPCNTNAVIVLPDGSESKVGSGEYDFVCSI